MSTIVWCVAFGVAADTLVPWFFFTTCVSGEPAVTGEKTSPCWLWVGFLSSMGVVGGGKRKERANEWVRAATVAREENNRWQRATRAPKTTLYCEFLTLLVEHP
jgi:hypothetical protein